ncbi:hypothetical protein AAU01_14860 [Paenarthrobacter aurescens]|uniref:Uncharacterized protein n=1 Tax=Paenarthrobacter aurescens TaxID=43663 RepID=A0A4Y3NI05_PAEAU|nr:hypothetical protein AAU01_14860 [Paenarthrobacter aurescens]
MLGGDVFVIERHDVQALGELKKSVQVLVVANGRRGHCCHGGYVLTLGQNTEFEAQGGSGRSHHSCELAAANNANYWKSHKVQPTEPVAGSLILPLSGTVFCRGVGQYRASHSPLKGGSRKSALKWVRPIGPLFNGHGGS